MGTNYYLRMKKNYTPENSTKFLFYEQENMVQTLINGYVFNNQYYKDLDELNKDYFITYHIGKCSGGWKFALASYSKENILTLDDWKRMFNEPGSKIVNEYNENITVEEMLDIITKRSSNIPQEEDKIYVNGLMQHTSSCIYCSPTESYDILNYYEFS